MAQMQIWPATAQNGSSDHPGSFDPDIRRKNAEHMLRRQAKLMMAKPTLNIKYGIFRAAMAATFPFQDRVSG